MKLGIITDIHEALEPLQSALGHFRAENVDQIVCIGDVFRLGEHLGETVDLLKNANVIGVWGNHDFGLCHPSPKVIEKYGKDVVEFLSTLQPRLVVDDCHFMHVEPWLDPNEICDLWYFEGPPDTPDKLDRIFQSTGHRVMFAGHYHKWLAATRETILDWHGQEPLQLQNEQRYFIVIGALCEGRYAIFDTDTQLLIPSNLSMS